MYLYTGRQVRCGGCGREVRVVVRVEVRVVSLGIGMNKV